MGTFCYINGYLINSKFKFKPNQVFFSMLWMHLDGASHGFKTILYLKGKGIRLQLKKRDGHLCIYLKLGYSHKIFFHLPKNCWVKIYNRRRVLKLFTLNYVLLRNLILKIRSFYPLGLYKFRGFFVEKEQIKIIKGKSRLGQGFGGYYG